MKVYLVEESQAYESSVVIGVFTSLARAKRAVAGHHHLAPWTYHPKHSLWITDHHSLGPCLVITRYTLDP